MGELLALNLTACWWQTGKPSLVPFALIRLLASLMPCPKPRNVSNGTVRENRDTPPWNVNPDPVHPAHP